jgi:regulator of replication initiation timing
MSSANQNFAVMAQRIGQLEAANDQLSVDNRELQDETEELREENEELEAENEELRRQVIRHDHLLEHAYNTARGKIRTAMQRMFYATIDVLTNAADRLQSQQDRDLVTDFLRQHQTQQWQSETYYTVFPSASNRELSEDDDDEQSSSDVDSDEEQENDSEDDWESSADDEFSNNTDTPTRLASGTGLHVGRRYMHSASEAQESTATQLQVSTSGHRRRHGRRHGRR